jgi:hypothetical protein
MSFDRTWEATDLGPLPSLTNAGWMLFAPLNDITLHTLANLARLDIARLVQIQTPADWIMPRTRLPFCFRCLVLNPADVTALAASGHGLTQQLPDIAVNTAELWRRYLGR